MTENSHTNGELESPAQIAAEVPPSTGVPFGEPAQLARAKELVRALAVCHTNASLYPMSHPLVSQSLSDLVDATDELRVSGFPSVTVNIYKGTLFVENQVFPEESVVHRRMVEDLVARGISALTFLESFKNSDAAALAEVISDPTISDITAARLGLEHRNATGVDVAETDVLDSAEHGEKHRENKARARQTYNEGLAAMHDVETQAKLGRVFEVAPLQGVVSSLLENLFRDPAAVLGLTAIKGHDDYTLNHSINVCILAISLGTSLGLDSDALRSLGLSALLYDLGKVRIPEEILNKQGPLTADEWRIVKRHAEEGADLLKRIQVVDQMPMVVAYEHHQRHDLQGYPAPVKEEQHLFSKVVALCDAYDAMTTRRPFRREIRPDKALAVLMQGRGKAYDPNVTKALVAMLGIYPMGAVIVLDDGSTAVVFRVNNDDLLHPRVKVLTDAAGRWYDEPEVLDLRVVDASTGQPVRSIIDCIPASDAGIDDVWQYL
ncbi:MAG: HD-GYP domain-containing protein [Coriobacteriia bacterium]|jgi:HD-GYP domain-containing protein (c-di-GMP phosphodiesterase class II)|nr:HD-GYP domain-containing protein [Coriobacteriia bacterium]